MINEPKGQLNILFPLEFCNVIISELLTELAKRYPEIKLSCNHYSSTFPDNAPHYDLAFVLHETDLPPSNWIAKTLLSFPQSIYVGHNLKNEKSPIQTH